jgi:hypothetical protein
MLDYNQKENNQMYSTNHQNIKKKLKKYLTTLKM